MAIAYTVEKYLNQHRVPYQVVSHPRAVTSLKTAAAANIRPDMLAKAVLLEDDQGYVVAVLPATHHIKMNMLRRQMGRNIRMASEDEIAELFTDCEIGAIPALGPAYGIETVWDDSLAGQSGVYFEAGDHEELIRVSAKGFVDMLGTARHGQFTSRM
jgi:Ala-tRNA(Pro) deacylase